MLEPPSLPEQTIVAALREAYAVDAVGAAFLPVGADGNTAAFHVAGGNGESYFLKLRRGEPDTVGVTAALPHWLHALGLRCIVDPKQTRDGQLAAPLAPYTMILYPFVEGIDGYQAALTESQWTEFGAAMAVLHSLKPPQALAKLIPREAYSPAWRDAVGRYQRRVQVESFDEPVAARLAAFMRAREDEISGLVERSQRLAHLLAGRDLETVLCHSDIHPGNLLLTPSGEFYIVDWDAPIFAPRERDLALIGGEGAGIWNGAQVEALFYESYEGGRPDPAALAYYRSERIIWDVAAFCEQLLDSAGGGEDRERSYRFFTSNFLPDHELDVARRTEAGAGW